MVIHNVYFWLQDDLTDTERQQFVDGVKSLLTIESVHGGYVGVPAGTEPRPIIDRSYDYALVVLFESLTDHDAYQDHATHDAFRELASLWQRVQIYDSETV